ncbi:MFS transporter [Cellulophaga sp. E16_2]|uniref:MFS transporter n=1 Tax=Cellulophaga sp. E16_2 TaxID=2789297 RepID=UPI001A916C42|nr:MFS transporter [Cellulophaga sp. E16_2]MBO0593244.1 MFS transporter [Cellulophaga sp. E16_2]
MSKNLSNSVLYLMSISSGLVVANLYYNQPLLHQMVVEFGVSESAISNVPLATQLGYAFGLLFIVPLGDKVSNKKIIQFDFALMILSLIAASVSSTLYLLIISSFFIGFSSALPQLFVPMVAQLSDDKGRGRAIGIVMSGLLIGILGSRVLSGLIGKWFGWRFMFSAATVLMVLLFILLQYKLPKIKPNYKGSYSSLLKSIGHYFKTEPSLRLAALRGGLGFAGLSVFWTTFVFLMEDHFNYDSDIAGAFGVFGIVGALGATVVGKMNDKYDRKSMIIFSTLLLMISWVILFFSGYALIGLALGVIIVDLGMQVLHITNQVTIFSRNPEARNRVNTVYMVGFFIGGALGTFLGAYAWQHHGWQGVSILGLLISLSILIVQFVFEPKTKITKKN